MLVNPGGNLDYLTGYRGSITTERITCLVVAPGREPVLLAPRLEEPLATGTGLRIVTWADGEDQLDALAALVPDGRVAVDAQMWFERSAGLVARRPGVELVPAADLIVPLRAGKSETELVALREAAAAIDEVHAAMPSGYNSDSTRTYVIGTPDPDFRRLYDVLQRAQATQCEAVAPGVIAEDLDRIGRDLIAEAGFGEHFIHRTGHGIGLEVHEEPYVVAGNREPLAAGAVFSIEPGIYLPGIGGARIEDIVACVPGGGERLNRRPRDLGIL